MYGLCLPRVLVKVAHGRVIIYKRLKLCHLKSYKHRTVGSFGSYSRNNAHSIVLKQWTCFAKNYTEEEIYINGKLPVII